MPYAISLVARCPAADAPHETAALIRFAQAAERLGYAGIWLDDQDSAAPDIIAVRLLSETGRLRIGLGDALLRQHGAAKLAAVLRLLSALAPGRVDLALTAADHPEAALAELARLLHPSSQSLLPHGAAISARADAALAARLGWMSSADAPVKHGPPAGGNGGVSLRVSAIIASSRSAAAPLAAAAAQRPELVGTGADVRAGLDRLSRRLGVSEFVLEIPVATSALQLTAIEELAAAGLARVAA